MSKILNLSTQYYIENHIRYVFLDGFLCKNVAQCYDTLHQQLSLPDYFGRNLDALDEVLSDLEWIEEKEVKIIVMNVDHLLSDNPEKKNIFLDILNASDNEKVEVVYLGK